MFVRFGTDVSIYKLEFTRTDLSARIRLKKRLRRRFYTTSDIIEYNWARGHSDCDRRLSTDRRDSDRSTTKQSPRYT